MAVSIEIFGVHGYMHDVLKSKLKDLLDGSGIRYNIQDYQEIDDFIAEGLESVPAIRVNHNKQFVQGEHESIDDVVKAVYAYILEHDVETILCPVDFSDHALHAAKWAWNLARQSGMQLKLLHVHIPVTEAQYIVPADLPGMLEQLRTKLEEVATRLQGEEPGGYPICTQLEVGDPIQQITYASKVNYTRLVVLGTKGESNVLRQLFGSVSSAVAHHAHVPVILIPPEADYVQPEKILVAFHHELLSNGALNKLSALNHVWQAHIEFVHIRQTDEDFGLLRDKLLERLTSPSLPGFSFDIQEVDSSNKPIISTLLEFAQTDKSDVITVVTRHRNAIRRLISPGMTRKLSMHANKPILVLHET